MTNTHKAAVISGVVLWSLLGASALAQSTVTGTLTGGSSGTSSVTGTVTAPPGGGGLTGTVTAPPATTGGGGGGGGSGGGGGGNSPVVTDYCSNIDGIQSSLPAGYGVTNGICAPLSSGGTIPPGGGGIVLGDTTTIPGVPNTGAGTGLPLTLLALLLSMLAAGGAYTQLKRTA